MIFTTVGGFSFWNGLNETKENTCTFKLTFICQTFSMLIGNWRSSTNDSSAALIIDDGWERE